MQTRVHKIALTFSLPLVIAPIGFIPLLFIHKQTLSITPLKTAPQTLVSSTNTQSMSASATTQSAVGRGTTITATSCSRTDVQNAINVAPDGTTVFIPSGTCTWTAQVSVDKPKTITIQGAGIDRTVIVDNVSKTSGAANTVLLSIKGALGKTFRLTGMTFRGMAQDANEYNKGTIYIYGNAHKFRLDHLKFDKPGTAAVRYAGDLWGVVDHNYFDLSNHKQGNIVWDVGYGDESFASPLALGTDRAVYIEDNTFIGSGIAGAGPVNSFGGGRFVFRYNTIMNDVLSTHGTETGGRYRSVRSYEIYNNAFTTNYLLFTAIFLRGGTGVIFNNTCGGMGGPTGYLSLYRMDNYRTTDPRINTFGICDGRNPWDGNNDPTGYPCLDQLGRGEGDLLQGDKPLNSVTRAVTWPHQFSEPLYAWNNAWSPVPNNPGSLFNNSAPAVIQQGRDFFDGQRKPGYAPYTYPHPLVSGR